MYTRQFGGKRRVITAEGAANLTVHLLGPHPILRHFLDRMTFSDIVGSHLGTGRVSIIDHAQTLAVLVQNIILSPAPLYRIAEWTKPIDPSVLGLSSREKASINDDRVARSLDALTSARARGLFFRLALHVIKQFELDTRRIHHDTTTVTFHGKYRSSHGEPRITPGINKDHRPDLKQLVFGLNVTADGAVPISHEVYSGNRTDDTIHRSNLDYLRDILGRDDFIYVADSKLCTRKNLRHLVRYGGKFVTVAPRTRVEDKRFRKHLREGPSVRWRKLIEIENIRNKNDPPDIYWTTADGPQETTEGYRLVWYRSKQKMELDFEARQSILRKAEAELIDLGGRLNRGKLRTRKTIGKKVKEILRKNSCQRFLNVKIVSQTIIRSKYLRRGRPKKGDPVKQIRSCIFRLDIKRNKEAILSDSRADGVFPLVTNLESRKYAKKEILFIYKYQPYVEKRHALFKTELAIAPVYLKKPNRAVGLIHATFLAMTLDALIERALKRGMEQQGIKELPILPEGRMTKTPTTARLLEMFSDVSWFEFEQQGKIVTFPVELTPLQKQLLKILDMDVSAYT